MRPNILLLLSDQHTPGVAGFAGDPLVQTPNLDRLAERSVRFDTASCASPVCTPSRMCLLTGKEPHRCAAWGNHWVIFPEHTTWPGHFAAHGYTTGLVGKMHFGGRDQMQGFEHRPYGDFHHGLSHQPEPLNMFPAYDGPQSGGASEIPESLLQDVVVTRETLAFILNHQSAEPSKPWFVCAGYSRPHSPFTAPARYIDRYRGRLPAPKLPDNHPENLDPYARRMFDATYCNVSLDEAERGRVGYYACVDFLDDCIGDLLDGLGRHGALENTIIIYTSDHGEMLGRYGLWGKGLYFEPSMGVPMTIAAPGVAGGQVVTHPVSLLDLFPTTCALAGVPIADDLDGVDISALLQHGDQADAPRTFSPSAFYHYGVRTQFGRTAGDGDPNTAYRAVRTCDHKYVEVQGGRPLLFDMKSDPDETTNLADRPEHADRCRAMRDMVFANFSWHQVLEQLPEDRQRLESFRSGVQPTTPNQYRLPDGRRFDAEASLYAARWLPTPPNTGGIIPQEFG